MKRAYIAAGERLLFLDAVRGVAALAVAAFHIYVFSAIGTELAPAIPRWADVLLRNGSLGVDVFFVLSGLVISASIANDRISWGYIGRFALKRSVRLDPPYWATLALATTLLVLTHRPPTLGRVLAHVGYLQLLLGYQNIVSQFWTLTYEVQFYLVLVMMVMFAQRLGHRVGWALAIIPLLISLAMQILVVDTHGWFIAWWYAFAFGAATTAMLRGRLSFAQWTLVASLVIGVGVLTSNLNVAVVAVSGCTIGLLGRAGALASLSGGRALQWLGRRSYSLYLIHFLGSNLAKMVSPRITSPMRAGTVFALALGVSLLAAEVLYRLVEAPAHRLSRSVGSILAARSRDKVTAIGSEAVIDQPAA